MRESESTLAWQARRIEFLEAKVAELEGKLNYGRCDEIALALNRKYRLPPIPCRLVAALYMHSPNAPATKEHLLDAIGSEAEPKCMDVWIFKIRQKLGSDAIETIWAVGYIMPEAGRRCVEAALADMHKSGERAV